MKTLQMKHFILSFGVALLMVGVGSAQSVLYFPQFVDGPLGNTIWASAMAVTNPAAIGTAPVTATITLTQDNGTPLNVPFTDPNHLPISNTFQIAGGQTKLFNSPVFTAGASILNLPFSLGFATVTSNAPLIGGLVFYEVGSLGQIIGEAGVLSAIPLTKQATIVVKDNNTDTAVAFANPETGTATITFQLLDQSGTALAPSVTRTLAANNHTAFYISQLFPSVTAKIYGSMRITSDVPVVSTALLFSLGSFSTLPLFPFQ